MFEVAQGNPTAPFRLSFILPHMRQLLPLALLVATTTAQAQLQVSCSGGDVFCSNAAGEVHTTVTGGAMPYSYDWNTGDTTGSIFNLPPGSYTVTVTDANQDQATCTYTVLDLGPMPDLTTWVGSGGLSPCENTCNGGFRVHYPPGLVWPVTLVTNPPLTVVDAPFLGQNAYSHAQGACAGAVISFTLVDGNGCMGSGSATILAEHEMNIDVLQTTGTCTGNNSGGATVRTITPFNMYEPGFGDVWVEDQFGNEVSPANIAPNGDTAIFTFTGLAPGNWTAFQQGMFFDGVPGCIESTPFTIADLGFNCGQLSGRLHLDENADCLQDVDEVGMANQLLRIQPGPYYAMTDANGDYSTYLPYGSYTLEQLNPDAVQRCPVAAPIPFDVVNGLPDPVIDIADSLGTAFDLEAHTANTIARPGFTFNYNLWARNVSGYPGDPVTLDFTWDPLFTFVSSSVAPTALGGNTAQWQLPAVLPFGSVGVMVTLQVPPDPLLIGTYHSSTLVATSIMPEGNAGNNTNTEDLMVMGSYDPNDKQARTSSRAADAIYFLDLDEHIDYTIRFQNTGNDTAFTVVVTDTISELHDMATLQMLGASHAFVPSIVGTNVLKFTFNNILLVDSTTNEPASHGFVRFRLKPTATTQSTPLLTIANNADIFFDFNPPVRTNTTELLTDFSVRMAEADANTLLVYPVPVHDALNVRLANTTVLRVQVLGTDGRVLHQRSGTSTLDVSQLAAGTYVLRIFGGDGAEHRARFVKQ